MTTHYVDVEALNLRSEAEVADGNRIGVLSLGQPVDLIDGSIVGWHKVRVAVDGQSREGFVKAEIGPHPVTGFVAKASLRLPVSAPREALVAQAFKQWLRFEKGLGKENAEPFFKFVGEMWKAIGQNLDGKDTDIPWSAAAISFMVRGAAATVPAYGKFKFAAAHSKYIHDAISKRSATDAGAPFWGFQLFEAKPQIGDIVGRWREVPRTYQDAAMSDSFKSHTDVIVSVAPDFILGIGGNIGDSVGITRYPKEPSGHLSGVGGAIVLMVNRAG